jgi:hypothetical protein
MVRHPFQKTIVDGSVPGRLKAVLSLGGSNSKNAY